jgi:hypothetical protein
MAAKKPDDFDATRSIIDALEPFNIKDRDRIIRWACEKLGMKLPASAAASLPQTQTPQQPVHPPSDNPQGHPTRDSGQSKNIKSFLTEKSPNSENSKCLFFGFNLLCTGLLWKRS